MTKKEKETIKKYERELMDELQFEIKLHGENHENVTFYRSAWASVYNLCIQLGIYK